MPIQERLAAFSSEPGTPSAEQSYSVSGSNLTDDITLTAPADFEISETSGSGFGNSLTLTQSGGDVAETPIYVRFNRATEGTSSGDITHNQESTLELDVFVPAATDITFWRRVSTEGSFDYLRFYIGNSMKGEWSGIGAGWQEKDKNYWDKFKNYY
mgnify:CR=1 FL=1